MPSGVDFLKKDTYSEMNFIYKDYNISSWKYEIMLVTKALNITVSHCTCISPYGFLCTSKNIIIHFIYIMSLCCYKKYNTTSGNLQSDAAYFNQWWTTYTKVVVEDYNTVYLLCFLCLDRYLALCYSCLQ